MAPFLFSLFVPALSGVAGGRGGDDDEEKLNFYSFVLGSKEETRAVPSFSSSDAALNSYEKERGKKRGWERNE